MSHHNRSSFLRALKISIFIFYQSCLFAKLSLAVGFDGQLRTGVYSSQVSISDDTIGNGVNNIQVVSTRLNLDVSDIAGGDMVTIDVRDKHDFFGALDSELLELKSKNVLLVRELAYKQPWHLNRLYFSVGRFPISEANVLVNDGVEAGYRINRNNRFSLFGGVADQTINLPREISEDLEGYDSTQFGAFWHYEDNSPALGDSVRMSNAIAQAPTVNLVDAASRLYYHHYGLWLLKGDTRITSYLDLDLNPNPNLRKLFLGYHLLGRYTHFSVNLTRLHQDDYRLKRDFRYELDASKMTILSTDLLYRHSGILSSEYVLALEDRAVDGLLSFDAGLGLRLKEFFTKTSVIGFLAGYRSHFISKDLYLRLRLDHYSENFGFHGGAIYRSETYENGDKLNPLTLNGEISFSFSSALRGSASLSYTGDERVDILSFYLALGYNFSGQTSNIRQKPADFERI